MTRNELLSHCNQSGVEYFHTNVFGAYMLQVKVHRRCNKLYHMIKKDWGVYGLQCYAVIYSTVN